MKFQIAMVLANTLAAYQQQQVKQQDIAREGTAGQSYSCIEGGQCDLHMCNPVLTHVMSSDIYVQTML